MNSYFLKHKSKPIWMHITDEEVMNIEMCQTRHFHEYLITRDNLEAYSVEDLNKIINQCDMISPEEFKDAAIKVANRIKHFILPTPKTIGNGEV